jgi:hypothetical protein
MLQRGNPLSEVPMFSLIALYFEYRKAQSARAQAIVTADAKAARAANDVASNRAVAKAA